MKRPAKEKIRKNFSKVEDAVRNGYLEGQKKKEDNTSKKRKSTR